MSVNRSLASSLGWLVVAVLAVSTTLPSCSGGKHYGDDDDDDDSSSGAGGASSNGLGSQCDSKHSCASDLMCTAGFCVPKGAGAGGTSAAPAGSLGGPCESGNSCDSGLHCTAGFCFEDSTGSGGTTGTQDGSFGGHCYPNDTCDSGLVCTSDVCIPDVGGVGGDTSGTGGASLGGSSNGGSQSSSGGTQSSSGGSQSSTGGTHSSSGGTSSSSGGTGGSSSGSGGSSSEPSTLIVSNDGGVADGSNTVGISGQWYIFYDTYSTISALPNGVNFEGAGPDICVEGSISHLDDYGPTVALNLNQPDPDLDPGLYTPLGNGVTGFSFEIDGDPMPSSIQVTLNSDTMTNYCKYFTPPSTSNSFSISQLTFECWNPGGSAASTGNPYQALQFQLPVNYFADGQSFAFCIRNLRALTN